MAIKEMMIAIGSVIMTTSALGTWKRKRMITALTMRPSSISFSFKSGDRFQDEVRTVIGGDDLYARQGAKARSL